jgi:hypothetical protein
MAAGFVFLYAINAFRFNNAKNLILQEYSTAAAGF